MFILNLCSFASEEVSLTAAQEKVFFFFFHLNIDL